jgi:hypothetical protein
MDTILKLIIETNKKYLIRLNLIELDYGDGNLY